MNTRKREVKAMPEKDWLAFIPMFCGGTWARGGDRSDTIRRCLRMCKSDWSGMADLAGQEVDVIIGDVTGYDTVNFDQSGLWTEPETVEANMRPPREYLPKDRIEVIRYLYPGKQKKRA